MIPVPQPVDFLAAYGKPKKPRLRSPSPCPYARAAVVPDAHADVGAGDISELNNLCATASVFVLTGPGGEGGGPSGSQVLGGPPSATQPPSAGVAEGVVTDGVVRACQAFESPEVPHLPVPGPDGTARGVFWVVPNSPLHAALRFNHFTPNPSAPSQSSALSFSPSASPPSPPLHACCAAAVLCSVCGDECGPDAQYGKCQNCLDAAFHAYAARRAPVLVQHYVNSSPSNEGMVASTVCSATLASNSSPSIEGTAALVVASSFSYSSTGQSSPKRLRVEPPPHRKAGPPKL